MHHPSLPLLPMPHDQFLTVRFITPACHSCQCLTLNSSLCVSNPRDGLVSLLASSAGGIPAAQTIYEIPHLIASAALRSPLVDVYNAYVQGTLLLGEHERAEWGPDGLDESKYLAYLRRICPTSSMPTESTRLPAMIVSTYTNDTRVQCRSAIRDECAGGDSSHGNAYVCM